MTQQELGFSESSNPTLRSSKVLVETRHTKGSSSNARLIAVWDEESSNWRPIQPELISLQKTDTKLLNYKYGNPWGLRTPAVEFIAAYIKHGSYKMAAKEVNRSHRSVAAAMGHAKKKMKARHLAHVIELFTAWVCEMKRKEG